MARKDDTSEYMRSMQQDIFDCLAKARSLEELSKRAQSPGGPQEVLERAGEC
jgi:hypothetical protein